VADRVLRDLHEHAVAALERQLDAPRLVARLHGIPVDLAGVEHGVAAAADVDEGGLHARQHVLHAAEVDVADERGLLAARDVVLDEHVVLEHGDLDATVLRAHDHVAVDGLAAGEELGLGDDGAAASGLAAVAATLLLGLEARRSLDPLRLGDQLHGAPARLALLSRGVIIVGRRSAATSTVAPRALVPDSDAPSSRSSRGSRRTPGRAGSGTIVGA
jgi:hypothetical protein